MVELTRAVDNLENFERLVCFLDALARTTSREMAEKELFEFSSGLINSGSRLNTSGGIFYINELDWSFVLGPVWPSQDAAYFVEQELDAQEKEGIVGWCIREEKSMVTPAFHTEMEDIETGRLRNCFISPLLVKGKLIGILLIYIDLGSESISSSMLQVLNIAVSQASLMMEFLETSAHLTLHSESLEKIVAERTVELSEKNKILCSQMEELKRMAEEVNASANAKLQFLANMSHELRTPLASIIGMGQLLSDTLLTPEQLSYVNTIDISGNNLLALINDLLDFSRLSNGKNILQETSFNLVDMMNYVYSTALMLKEGKPLELFRDEPSCKSYPVRGDERRIQQIVLNLVNNAIKYTTQGWLRVGYGPVDRVMWALQDYSKLDKLIPAVLPSLQQEKDRITREKSTVEVFLFFVYDSGIGVPPEKLDLLFEPFEQMDPSNSRGAGGVGLGLAICRQLATMMGGRVSASSLPGAGSFFWLMLLLQEIDAASVNKRVDSELEVQKYYDYFRVKVLLADDNATNRMLGRNFLEKFGCSVDEARDGKEAADLAIRGDYAVVFMDCQMPGVDGFAATKLIRDSEEATGKHTPVVALTAHALEGYKELCIKSNIDGYLSKPVSKEKLLKELLRFCDSHNKTALDVVQTITSTIAENNDCNPVVDECSVDMNTLSEQLGDDHELTAKLFSIFIQETRTLLKKIKTAFTEKSFDLVRRQAHQMRGMALNLNATKMAAISLKLELEKSGNENLVADLIETLSVEHEKVILFLTSQLNKNR